MSSEDQILSQEAALMLVDRLNEIPTLFVHSLFIQDESWSEGDFGDNEAIIVIFPTDYHEEEFYEDVSGRLVIFSEPDIAGHTAMWSIGKSQSYGDIDRIIAEVGWFVRSRLTDEDRLNWAEDLSTLEGVSLVHDLADIQVGVAVQGHFPVNESEREVDGGSGSIYILDHPMSTGWEAICEVGGTAEPGGDSSWKFRGTKEEVVEVLRRFLEDGTIPENDAMSD